MSWARKETSKPSDYSKFSHTSPNEHANLMSRSNCGSCHRQFSPLAVPLHKACAGCHLFQFTVFDPSAEANPICIVCHTKDGLNSSNPPIKSLNGNAQIMPGAGASPQPRTPTPSPNGRNGNVSEAPDNSYIVSNHGFQTRYFRDARCPIQRIAVSNNGLTTGFGGEIFLRSGASAGRGSLPEAASLLIDKCVDIV